MGFSIELETNAFIWTFKIIKYKPQEKIIFSVCNIHAWTENMDSNTTLQIKSIEYLQNRNNRRKL